MKKILFGVLLTATVCACEMDLYRSDTMTSAKLKDDPSAAVYTTDGNYSMFKDILTSQTRNSYMRQWFLMTELRGDNVALSTRTPDPLFTANAYAEAPQEENLTYIWWVSYKIIYGANSNIEAIPEGSSAYSDHLLGENYFLRALCHMNLLQLFAKPYSRGADNPGVVLRTSTDMSVTERATVGQVYEQAVKDLEKAAALMAPGGRGGKDKGYASHEAALGLLSRAYLHMGEYDKCIEVCNQLLGGDASAWLDTDLDNYFANARTSKETLWCIGVDKNDVGEFKGQIGSMYYSPNGVGGDGWCEMYWSDPLIELMNRYPEDKRLAAYFEYSDPQGDDKLMVSWPDHTSGSYRSNALYIATSADGIVAENKKKAENIAKEDKAKSDYSITTIDSNGDGYTITRESGTFNNNTQKFEEKTQTLYTVKAKSVNGFTQYYIEGYATDAQDDDDFAGGTRVYVRPAVKRGNGVGASFPAFMMKKFTGQEGTPLLCSPVMLRYAEVVLNRAEAYAHKGDAANALADVNVIRKRAGLTGDAEMTQANMGARGYSDVLDVVLDERRMELCFEGFRSYDLYRNGRSINRKFSGMHTWEILTPEDLDTKHPYYIPYDEVSVTNIPQNNK